MKIAKKGLIRNMNLEVRKNSIPNKSNDSVMISPFSLLIKTRLGIQVMNACAAGDVHKVRVLLDRHAILKLHETRDEVSLTTL